MDFLHRRDRSPHPRDFPDLYGKYLENSSKVVSKDSLTLEKASEIFENNVPSSSLVTPSKPVEAKPLRLPSITEGNKKRDAPSLVSSLRKKIQDTREP